METLILHALWSVMIFNICRCDVLLYNECLECSNLAVSPKKLYEWMFGNRTKVFYVKLELGRYIFWQECLLIDEFGWQTEAFYLAH